MGKRTAPTSPKATGFPPHQGSFPISSSSLTRASPEQQGELSKAPTPMLFPLVPAHRDNRGNSQQQPGLVQPPSTPKITGTLSVPLSQLSPHQHRPTALPGVSFRNRYNSKHKKKRCKLKNSALGRRYLGLCLAHTSLHAAPTCCIKILP